ncbi:FUSC family protein [Pontibacillus litoralis]|uniref:Integral membrane bound transporter domain-containing protein n=1 Tax=Pontibacillus litoralis JSM 072002 TaxID=1385512 RepID=A0A0A5G389_9BACI|nr:FUSC family protein [Pontibacillus litoralis]KGX85603.1 hypothetical protein N784_08825 [Pontibacillus litoralis JSM 072002]
MKSTTLIYQLIQHYWARLSASDPGMPRLAEALKTVFSALLAVATTSVLINFFDIGEYTVQVNVFSGIIAVVCIHIIAEEPVDKRKVTFFSMGAVSFITFTLGSYLNQFMLMPDIAILITVFLAFYLSKYNTIYFSICLMAFFSIYYAVILRVEFEMVPWFYISIVNGLVYAFLIEFILLKDQPDKSLKRSMRSFHIQTNLILNLVKQLVTSPNLTSRQVKTLEKNLTKVNEYARHISGQLSNTDPSTVWKGLTARELRLYVYDADMLMNTLLTTVHKLREIQQFEKSTFQNALLEVIDAIRDVKVLRDNDAQSQLKRAEKALQVLRQEIKEESIGKENEEWLYLVRRIETITNHVIEGAYDLHRERQEHLKQVETYQETKEEVSHGIDLNTKKAIKALIAGTISIYLGYTLTPGYPYWILLTSFIIFMGTESVGKTFKKANQRILGTILGSIIGFGIADQISSQLLEITIIFVCIFMAFYIYPVSYSFMIFWITVIIAILYDLLLGGITVKIMGVRIIDTFIGSYIGFLTATFIFPTKTKDKVTDYMKEFIDELEAYMSSYMDQLADVSNPDDFAERSFNLDQKLDSIRQEKNNMNKRSGRLGRGGVEHWYTVLAAINYYAKQLHATRHPLPEMTEEIHQTLTHSHHYVTQNIRSLKQLLNGNTTITIWQLEEDRKLIEQFTDEGESIFQRLFVYKLYHVWYINNSIVTLAKELGANIELSSKQKQE